jgi:hypothetical protein
VRRVRLFGDIGESSGYAKAVKNFAEAFSKSNIPTKLNFSKSISLIADLCKKHP